MFFAALSTDIKCFRPRQTQFNRSNQIPGETQHTRVTTMTRTQRSRRDHKKRNRLSINPRQIAALMASNATCIAGSRVYIKRGITQIGGHAGTVIATCQRHGGTEITVRIDPKGSVQLKPMRLSLADVIALDEGMNRPLAEAHDIHETAYLTVLG